MFSTQLDNHEIKWIKYVAEQRNTLAVNSGFKPLNNQKHEDTKEDHIYGTASEYAAAKILNLHWNHNIGIEYEVDLFPDIQIRTTKHQNGRLIIRKDDSDDEKFLFVTRKERVFTLEGWLWGKEGKQSQWLINPTDQSRPAAYFIPKEYLRGCYQLIENTK